MTILLLEALAAVVLFLGAIWWTMFSGRKKDVPPEEPEPPESNADPVDGRD